MTEAPPPSTLLRFASQAQYSRHRNVTRNAVSGWKRKGLLVITTEGLIDIEATDKRLAERPESYRGGVTSRPVAAQAGNKSGNTVTPVTPPGYKIIDQMDQAFDAGAMSMGLAIFYSIGATVAALAIAAGASCQVAYSLHKSVECAVLFDLQDRAVAGDYAPFRGGAEPAFIDAGSLAEVNWPNLARLAGEEIDLDAWQAHHEAVSADPVETING